jgi:YegS/Rv2252/BmrU family lipid kinase
MVVPLDIAAQAEDFFGNRIGHRRYYRGLWEDALKRVAVIYNPAAGRRKVQRMRQAVEVMRQTVRELEVLETTGAGSATELAREAARRGVDTVVACGGDGTANEVLNGVAGTETAVGVLPAGTANVLAAEIGLPGDVVKAARMLPQMKRRRVALGRIRCRGVEGRYFALACGAGLDADLMAGAEEWGKKRWGMLAYWAAGLRMLGRRLETFRVEAEGRSWDCSMALATRVRDVGGGLRVARRSHLLDDDLEVAVFPSRSTWRYIGYAAAALAGRLGEVMTTRRVEMTGEGRVEVDGEVVGRLPAVVEMAPGAVTLVGPWTT